MKTIWSFISLAVLVLLLVWGFDQGTQLLVESLSPTSSPTKTERQITIPSPSLGSVEPDPQALPEQQPNTLTELDLGDPFIEALLSEDIDVAAKALADEFSSRVKIDAKSLLSVRALIKRKLESDQSAFDRLFDAQGFDESIYHTPESELSDEQRAQMDLLDQQTEEVLADQEDVRAEFAEQLTALLDKQQLSAFTKMETERFVSARRDITSLIINQLFIDVSGLKPSQRQEIQQLTDQYLNQTPGQIAIGSTIGVDNLMSEVGSSQAATDFFSQISELLSPEQRQVLGPLNLNQLAY